MQAALRALAAQVVGRKLTLELDQLLVGLGRGAQALGGELLVPRAVEAVQLDGEAGQLLELGLVDLAQVAQLAPEQEPLDRREPLLLRGIGGVARRGGLRECGLDLLLIEGRERLLPMDPRLLEMPEELGCCEPAVLG